MDGPEACRRGTRHAAPRIGCDSSVLFRPAERPAHFTTQVVVKSRRDSACSKSTPALSTGRTVRQAGQCTAPTHAQPPASQMGRLHSPAPLQPPRPCCDLAAESIGLYWPVHSTVSACIVLADVHMLSAGMRRTGPACGLRCARRLHAARGRGSGPQECLCSIGLADAEAAQARRSQARLQCTACACGSCARLHCVSSRSRACMGR